MKSGSVSQRYVTGSGKARFRCYSARLGEALSWPSVCLVLCDTGEDRPHEATRDAKSLDGLASRLI